MQRTLQKVLTLRNRNNPTSYSDINRKLWESSCNACRIRSVVVAHNEDEAAYSCVQAPGNWGCDPNAAVSGFFVGAEPGLKFAGLAVELRIQPPRRQASASSVAESRQGIGHDPGGQGQVEGCSHTTSASKITARLDPGTGGCVIQPHGVPVVGSLQRVPSSDRCFERPHTRTTGWVSLAREPSSLRCEEIYLSLSTTKWYQNQHSVVHWRPQFLQKRTQSRALC